MQFGKPVWFWLLGIVPFLVLGYLAAFRSRRRALSRFAGSELAPKLLLNVSPVRRRIKAACMVSAVLFLVLTLTEPKWGFEIREVTRQGIDLVVMLDVSKSMLAEDLKPSRLARAKLEIESLLGHLAGDRVGLVVFAGSSFIQCPLTLDYAVVRLFLDDVGIQSVPRGGTDIGGAIRKALAAFEGSGGGEKVILLLTDGEDHGGELDAALAAAKEKEVTLYPVGVGHPDGSPIPISDEAGQVQYLRDARGEVVISKRDLPLLERIAEASGGKVGLLGVGDFSLEQLYLREIAQLEKEAFSSRQKKEYHHRFQWPLALALFFLSLEGILRERR